MIEEIENMSQPFAITVFVDEVGVSRIGFFDEVRSVGYSIQAHALFLDDRRVAQYYKGETTRNEELIEEVEGESVEKYFVEAVSYRRQKGGLEVSVSLTEERLSEPPEVINLDG